MSDNNQPFTLALAQLDRQPGEPQQAYITPSDVKTSYEYLREAWLLDSARASIRRTPPIRGVNLSPWATGVELWEYETANLAPTHVTVPIRVEADDATSSEVTVNADDLERAALYDPGSARLIIEPYPWIDSGAESETDWEPDDFAAWETSYTAALVEIAQSFPGAWGFYVGSNLVLLEGETERWQRIISAVRMETGAQIIYRTNWWVTAEFEPETTEAFLERCENPLFGDVDMIAVAAYFELTETARPNTDEIAACWRDSTIFERFQDAYAECEYLAQRWGKPMLFGELICAKYEGALVSPWRPWNPPDIPPPVDWMVQARYFAATYDVFRDAPWWHGFSVYGVAYPFTDGGYNLTPAARRWFREHA